MPKQNKTKNTSKITHNQYGEKKSSQILLVSVLNIIIFTHLLFLSEFGHDSKFCYNFLPFGIQNVVRFGAEELLLYIDICLFWWVGVAAYTEWSLSSVTECTMQFRNIQVLLSNLEDVAYDQHNSDCKRESFYFILSSKWCCCLYLNGLMHFTPFLSATILRLTGLFRVPQLWILNHNLKIKYFRACHYNG